MLTVTCGLPSLHPRSYGRPRRQSQEQNPGRSETVLGIFSHEDVLFCSILFYSVLLGRSFSA